jgi:hypothetical protein
MMLLRSNDDYTGNSKQERAAESYCAQCSGNRQCEALTRAPFLRDRARVVDEILLSRNFAKYLFRISLNNYFYFAKFRIAKYYEISRNFCDEIKIYTG